MSYRDRHDRGSMGGGSRGDGDRGQESRQDQFEDQGRYGGWNEERMYSGGRDHESSSEPFGGGYGQGGYGQSTGRQSTDWGNESFRGESYSPQASQGAGGWQPNAPQGWGGQGRTRGGSWDQSQDWEQGPSGRGNWGQGYSDQDYGAHSQSRTGSGAQRYGGQDASGRGRSGGGGGAFYDEEVWLIPGPHSGRGPRGYQRNDQRIEEDVCERLTQHGQVDAEDIQIQVTNGEVTLTGTVESRQVKRMVEDVLDSISGVKDVHNQLRVQQSQRQGQGTSDQDQVIGQKQKRDGRSGSAAGRGQSESGTQSRRSETAGGGASSS